MSSKKTKNKDFLKWTRAETCHMKDNIVSTDWHERLERNPMFVPTYAKGRPEMTYIMSMEYGRMWHKEKDEWFSQIFKDKPKDQRMIMKRKKLRKEFLEAKKQAEIKIRERKERLAREAEAKAKAEVEAQEKGKRIKAKMEKSPVKKKTEKTETKTKPEEKKQETEPDKKDECPKGWTPVEITLQCECAANKVKDEVARQNETESAKKEPEVEDKPEGMPCHPGCIQNQIAEAVRKMTDGDMQD